MLGGPRIALSSASGATASASTTKVFSFTGGEQTFKVPDNVTSLDVVAVGASGGDGFSLQSAGGPGGRGAVASASLPVTPGQTVFVEVGGTGGAGDGNFGGGLGFNGGGAGHNGLWGSGGGGGATDIRTISRAGVAGDSLSSRLLVAGGGGGGGGSGNSSSSAGGGGGGGGDAGQDPNGDGSTGHYGASGATFPGGGGTQSDGGYAYAGSEKGSFGQGGNGGAGTGGGAGGGGGGGKFGGGSGLGGSSSAQFAAGAGGGSGSTRSLRPRPASRSKLIRQAPRSCGSPTAPAAAAETRAA